MNIWTIHTFIYTIGLALNIVCTESYTCEPNTGEILVRSSDSNSQFKNHNKFYSPNWPKSYQTGTRCVYRFVANKGEKVHIQFDYFELPSKMPDCLVDFLDVYIDVASSSLDLDRQTAILTRASSNEPQITTPFSAAVYSAVLDKSAVLGRFCGKYLKQNSISFISLHREIVLDFYSELQLSQLNQNSLFGFNGTFEFISDNAFYPGHVLAPVELTFYSNLDSITSCKFRIEASTLQHQKNSQGVIVGEIQSPTYPGYHPNGLMCIYQIVGLPNQRIQVDILDIDIHSGSPGCPVDYLQFYNELELSNLDANIIGKKICSRPQTNQSLQIVSDTENLLILFFTGTVSPQFNNEFDAFSINRRGFRLIYTFSKLLLPIFYLPGARHFSGTECTYVIDEVENMTATNQLKFPPTKDNAILMPNHECSFIFVGFQNELNLKTVSVGFEHISLPTPKYPNQSCDQGSLSIYGSWDIGPDQIPLQTKPSFKHAFTLFNSQQKPDQIICDRLNQLDSITVTNSYLNHYPILSKHNILILKFLSTGAPYPGLSINFVLNYAFKKDFGIPGQQINSGKCHYLYKQSTKQHNIPKVNKGWTCSPHYPQTTYLDGDCLYMFSLSNIKKYTEIEVHQLIRLKFDNWYVGEMNRAVEKTVANERISYDFWNAENCHENFVEIIQFYLPINDILISALTTRINYLSVIETSSDLWIKRWKKLEHELQIHLGINERVLDPIFVFCGTRIPRPIVSDQLTSGLLLRLHRQKRSNVLKFSLSYDFESVSSVVQTKLVQSSQTNDLNKQKFGGLINSPNYPNPYPKNSNFEWHIYSSNPNSQLQLHFQTFNLENCSVSVLRIYENTNPRHLFEFCGKHENLNPIILQTVHLVIRMHTMNEVVQAKGFQLVWTELFAFEKECLKFQCQYTKYCISELLRFNNVTNCGFHLQDGVFVLDNSDEIITSINVANYNLVHIGIGVLVAIFFLLLIGGHIYFRERKRCKELPMDDPLYELAGAKHQVAHSMTDNNLKESSYATLHSHSTLKPLLDNTNMTKNDCQFSDVMLIKQQQHFHNYHQHRHHQHYHHYHHHHHPHDVKHLCDRNNTRRSSRKSNKYSATTNGATFSDSIHTEVGSGSARNATSMADGGLLIRERMQKISIV